MDTYDARSALNPGMESWLTGKTEPEWLQIKANVVQAKRAGSTPVSREGGREVAMIGYG